MAANIFNEADYAAIKNRINQLNAQSQRQWGQMSLPQALEHCSIQLKKALGIIPETAYEGPAMYRTSVGRWLLFYAMPWPKGASTPSQMDMLHNGSPGKKYSRRTILTHILFLATWTKKIGAV